MIREYKDYVMDISASIQKIEEFTNGITAEDFEKDTKTVFATIRALEVIGEAAKKIPLSVRNKYNQIPWLQITGRLRGQGFISSCSCEILGNTP